MLHGLRISYRVADGGNEAARVGDVDAAQPSGGCGDHVLGVRHRTGEPRPVHLDHQLMVFGVKRETAAIADTTKTVGVDARGHILDEELLARTLTVGGESHGATIPSRVRLQAPDGPIGDGFSRLDWPVIVITSVTSGSYPLSVNHKRPRRRGVVAALLGVVVLAACSENPADKPPPTVAPAAPAVSPPITAAPAGVVRPLPIKATGAMFDPATSSLVVLGGDSLAVVPAHGGDPRTIPLPGDTTALSGDAAGVALLSTRGGYFRVDVRTGQVAKLGIRGHDGTDFTAIARRTDGKLVLGTADGAVDTLGSDTTVAAEVKIFARVDAIATQGNTAVVLDRGQTSVTTIDPSGGHAEHALRAGEGATTLTVDPVGRALVADTRGGSLLVFGVDPLILRQSYPVRDAPYGLAGTRTLAWVSLTAANVVVGYDLATGIPVEKVRYPTVRQPDVLAFDEAANTLYVVSGSGDGVQVIDNAGRPR